MKKTLYDQKIYYFVGNKNHIYFEKIIYIINYDCYDL